MIRLWEETFMKSSMRAPWEFHGNSMRVGKCRSNMSCIRRWSKSIKISRPCLNDRCNTRAYDSAECGNAQFSILLVLNTAE